MKTFLRFVLLAALLVPLGTHAQTLTVADGTATNSNVPVYGLYTDEFLRCQTLYPASMLADIEGENILGVTYYLSTPAAAAWTGTFEVRMMEVSDTALTAFLPNTTATLVYTGTLDATESTMEIMFDAPYAYEGGNLVIEVNETVTGNWKSATFAGIEATGASWQGHNSTSVTAITGTAQNFIPKTTFMYGEPPTCFKVKTPAVNAVTSNSITLAWVDTTNTSATYTIYQMIDSIMTVIEEGVEDTFYTVTDLAPNTEYTFGIATECDDSFTEWVTVSGRTSCAPEALPFTENFSATLYGNPCWRYASEVYTDSAEVEMVDIPNYGAWSYASSTQNGIEAGHYYTNIYGTSRHNWLITPEIDLTEVDAPLLTFNAVFTAYSGSEAASGFDSNATQQFKVLVSTNNGQTWSEAANIGLASIAGTSYSTQFVSLAPYAGQTVRVAFYAQSLVAGGDNNLHIDNINIEESTGEICYPPTNLVATNISSDDAILTWEGEGNFNVYLYNPETETDSLVGSTTGENIFYCADNGELDQNTVYTYIVRTDCGSSESVDATVTFRTLCSFEETPFTENFDADLSNNPCWKGANVAYTDSVEVTMGNITGWNYASSESNGLEAGHYKANIYSTSCKYWLITPNIDLSYVDSPALTFDAAFTTYSGANPASGFESNTSQEFLVLVSTDNGQSWEVASNVSLSAIASTEYTPIMVDLSDYVSEEIRIAFYAQSLVAGGDNNLHIDNIYVGESTGEICMPVANLTASDVTATSATLSWISDNENFSVYSVDSTGEITPIDIVVIDNAVTISGLTPTTTYTYGVVTNCSDNESLMRTVTFTTGIACDGENCNIAIYAQDAWGDGWGSDLVIAQSGVTVATYQMPSQSASSTTIYDTFSVSVCSTLPVSFSWISGGTYAYDYEASFQIVDGGGTVDYTVADASELTSGEVFFTLEQACPSCLPALNLTANDITATSATLSWEGEAANYNVYSIDETGVATPIDIVVIDNTVTISGLTPATTYTYGVRAVCDGEESNMATVTFTTELDCETFCNITIVGADSYGDGWNGNAINVIQSGVTVGTFTLTSGSSLTEEFSVCSTLPVSFKWISGSYSYENSFEIFDGGMDSLYSASGSDMVNDSVFLTIEDFCPSCIKPTVSVVSTGETTITIAWEGGSVANSYAIYLDGELVAMTNTTTEYSYTFTDLAASSTFVIGVQAICSEDDASSIATVTASTGCADVTSLPYNEGFESGELGCWSTVNGSTDGQPWNAQPAFSDGSVSPHHGDYMAASWSWNSSAMHANAWLISPKFVLPAAEGDSITFSWWHRVNANYPTELYDVMLSTTTNDTSAFTTTLLSVTPDSTTSWIRKNVNLFAYAGQSVYIAFHHHDSYDQNYLLIDDINLNNGGLPAPVLDTVTVNITVTNLAEGTTNPAPGTHYFVTDEVLSVIALPATGYHNSGWVFTMIDGEGDTIYNNMEMSASDDFFDNLNNVAVYSAIDGYVFNVTPLFEADPTPIECSGTTCNLTVAGEDSYGDGWNGAELRLLQNGQVIGIMSVEEDDSTESFQVCNDYPVELLWMKGSYDDECSFTITNAAGTTVYSVASATQLLDNRAFASISTFCTNPTVVEIVDTLIVNVAVNNATMGTTVPVPGTYTYTSNDTVIIEAVPNTGYVFKGWAYSYVSDGVVGYDTVTGDDYIQLSFFASSWVDVSPVTFTALFGTPDTLTLNVAVNDPTKGTTSPVPGTYYYTAADTVWVSATATGANAFLGWTLSYVEDGEAMSEEISAAYNPVGFLASGLMDISPVTLTANFGAPDTLHITMAVNDASMGTTNPAPGTTLTYVSGDTITATAIPGTGYAFQGWYVTWVDEDGDTVGGTLSGNPAMILADMLLGYAHEMTMTAYFGEEGETGMHVVVDVNDPTMGTTNPAPGSHYFQVGDTASVVALPYDGYHLEGWSFIMMYNGTVYYDTTINYPVADFFNIFTNPWGVVEDGDEAYEFYVTANFAQGGYVPDSMLVIIDVNDYSMGTTDPEPGSVYFHEGEAAIVDAIAYDGFHLTGWTVRAYYTGYGLVFDSTLNIPMNNILSLFKGGEDWVVEAGDGNYTFMLTANFAEGDAPTSMIVNIEVMDEAEGTTNPGPGTYHFTEGQVASVIAIPADGYHLAGWMFTVTDPAGDPLFINQYYDTNCANFFDIFGIEEVSSGLYGYEFTITPYFEAGVGIEDVVSSDYKVYSIDNTIVVKGVENQPVTFFDVNGRTLRSESKATETIEYTVTNTGVYFVKVGNDPAKRVVVLR
ncbi:MAG: choice-of-anchor J domain-containing protein [bacterium]